MCTVSSREVNGRGQDTSEQMQGRKLIVFDVGRGQPRRLNAGGKHPLPRTSDGAQFLYAVVYANSKNIIKTRKEFCLFDSQSCKQI